MGADRARQDSRAAAKGDAADGKKIQFDELVEHATGEDDLSYPQIASALGLTQGAARVAVHRFRRRYRELLQDEIGQTLSSPDELADEISFLRSVLSKL